MGKGKNLMGGTQRCHIKFGLATQESVRSIATKMASTNWGY